MISLPSILSTSENRSDRKGIAHYEYRTEIEKGQQQLQQQRGDEGGG